MPSEIDPLLPQNTQSPEISSNGASTRSNTAEISYNGAPFTNSAPPPAYNAQAYQTYQYVGRSIGNVDNSDIVGRADDDERDKFPRDGIANGMARIFRGVFLVIFVVAFLSLVSSLFRDSDRRGGRPSPIDSPSHGRPAANRTIEDRVRDILEVTPLIDGHNDLAIFIRGRYANDLRDSTFRHKFEKGGMEENVDLPRLRSGRSGGAFWSSFVGCPVNASYDMTDANYATAVAHTLEQIDLLKRLQAQYPEDFTSATIGDSNAPSSGRMEMLSLWRRTRSLFGPLSIEGLHQVPPSAPMSTLRSYYSLGVRMATLTWNCHNPFADASIVMNDYRSPAQVVQGPFRPNEGALTNRGRAVVREMNRLGMIVDLSHTSYWTQKAVLSNATSRAPVVFSHSSAYALCPHPRNVQDDILDMVRATESVVMVNFSPQFISCHANETDPAGLPVYDERNNTLRQVARHIVYIGDRIGYEHVGLGSDFDGMGDVTPRGLEGVDKFPALLKELLEMGVSEQDVKKVVGENVLRVWGAVDGVRDRMRKEGVEAGVDSADGF